MNLSGRNNDLLFCNFNQDKTCFAVGTADGFGVFNTFPFHETFRRIFSSGGIAIVEMLYRSNLLALVGSGDNPRYHPNRVMIWDDHKNRCVGELMFKSQVYAVRLRRDRVVCVLENRVYCYRFKDLKLLMQTTGVNNHVMAVPGPNAGTVRVERVDKSSSFTITCHSSSLAQIALNKDGSLLATCSEKGTLIRLFCGSTGELCRELRRGSDRAEIYCLVFSDDSRFVACSSDKGTVHIFALHQKKQLSPGMSGGQLVIENKPEAQHSEDPISINTASGTGPHAMHSHLSESPPGTMRCRNTVADDRTQLEDEAINALAGLDGARGSANTHTTQETSSSSASSSDPSSENKTATAEARFVQSRNAEPTTHQLMTSPAAPQAGGHHAATPGSVHREIGAQEQDKNTPMTGLGFFQRILPGKAIPKYFQSEWSFAQLRGIEGRAIAAFDPTESTKLCVISEDGIYTTCALPESGGECTRLAMASVLYDDDDSHAESAGGGQSASGAVSVTSVDSSVKMQQAYWNAHLQQQQLEQQRFPRTESKGVKSRKTSDSEPSEPGGLKQSPSQEKFADMMTNMNSTRISPKENGPRDGTLSEAL